MKDNNLNDAIRMAGYRWEAGETPVSTLTEAQQQRLLGVDVPPNLTARVARLLAEEQAEVAHAVKRDWRDKDGQNFVTGIKDQKSCGSCVSFATVAAIETRARIEFNEPDWNLDLSEADLFFCGGGQLCDQGWWPQNALDYAKTKGIVEEICFPYQDVNVACPVIADRQDHLLMITEGQEIVNVSERKAWLDEKGPLIAVFAVYKDFMEYRSGVYRYVSGNLLGYHAVCCVGYDDEQGCWICKNSWNTGWGESGFFRIGYGEVGIDTEFPMWSVNGVSGALKPEENEEEQQEFITELVIERTFEDDNFVIWVNVDGAWRSKSLNSEGHLLNQISFDADAIQASYNGNTITRLRVWKRFQ